MVLGAPSPTGDTHIDYSPYPGGHTSPQPGNEELFFFLLMHAPGSEFYFEIKLRGGAVRDM